MKDELSSPQRLRTARAPCVGAASAYPFFFEASRWGGTPYRDPLGVRWWVTGAIALTWVGSYVSAPVRRRIADCLLGLVWLIPLHIGILLVANAAPPLLVVMWFVVLTGFVATASFSVSTTRQLLAYLAFVLAEALVTVLVVAEPKVHPAVLLLGVGTVVVLACVAVRAQVDSARRLVRSQANLQNDIRRRERTESALRDSEARANALLDTVPDVRLSLDGNGQHRVHDRGSVSRPGPALPGCRAQPVDREAAYPGAPAPGDPRADRCGLSARLRGSVLVGIRRVVTGAVVH